MPKTLNKRLLIWAGVVAAILMIPAIGKAPWTVSDYIFAGVVLFGAACIYEIVSAKLKSNTHRLLVGGAVACVVLMIWAWAVAGP